MTDLMPPPRRILGESEAPAAPSNSTTFLERTLFCSTL